MWEGLYEDEWYLVSEIEGHSFFEMLDAVANGRPGSPREVNPPLFFSLAWIAGRMGELSSWIRLPSVGLGAATVPLVFLLGARTVGRAAGVVAAGYVALSPFAIFYGNEARAYATAMFFAVLATLLLVVAVEDQRRRWWVAYALCAAALLYTHYTGVLVVAVHFVWVLWSRRDALRRLVVAQVAVALLYVPWLPFVHTEPADFGALAAIMGIDHWDALLQWLAGAPRIEPARLPGTMALALLAAGLAIGGAGRFAARRSLSAGCATDLRLVVPLALVAPLFCLLYGIVGVDMFLFPRNMIVSLPFLALAIGWVLTPPGRRARIAAVGLAGAALAAGAAKTLEDRFHRPNFPQAARLVEDRASADSLLVLFGRGYSPFFMDRAVALYAGELPPRMIAVPDERSVAAVFGRAVKTGRRHVMLLELEPRDGLPPPARVGWEQVEQRRLPGNPAIIMATYAPLRQERPPASVVTGRVHGNLDRVVEEAGSIRLEGWALGPDARPVRRVAAFAGDRLVAAGVPGVLRPDVAEGRDIDAHGIGYVLALPRAVGDRQRDQIRLFGFAEGVASPLRRCGPGISGFGC